MRAMLRYQIIRDLQNAGIFVMVGIITVIISKIENISELSLLLFLVLSTGIFNTNDSDLKKIIIFEKTVPVSINRQIQSKYVLLLLRTLASILLYTVVYAVVHIKLDYILFEQLILFFTSSMSMGVVVIYKNLMEFNMNRLIYICIQTLLISLFFIIDLIKYYLGIEMSVLLILGMSLLINFIFIIGLYVFTIKSVRNLRSSYYDSINVPHCSKK